MNFNSPLNYTVPKSFNVNHNISTAQLYWGLENCFLTGQNVVWKIASIDSSPSKEKMIMAHKNSETDEKVEKTSNSEVAEWVSVWTILCLYC